MTFPRPNKKEILFTRSNLNSNNELYKMKVLQVITYFSLNAFLISAKGSNYQPLEDHSNGTISQKPPSFDVSYNILEHLDSDLSKGIEFSTEGFATFNYSFANNEDVNVSVVGVGGTVRDFHALPVANITEQVIGPISIGANETANFQAGVKLNLPAGDFYLLPTLNVLKDDSPLRIGIRPLSITVNPPPMSFLNPSFLSVQLILGALIAGATYIFLTFNKSGGRKKLDKKTDKSVNHATVDQSWLPDTYKRAEKRKGL